MFKLSHAIVFVIFLSLTAQAHAQTFAFGGSSGPVVMTLYFPDGTSNSVDATDQGWWSPTQSNFGGNPNIITGTIFGIRWNDFFVFDLTAVTGTAVAASLNLDTWSVDGAPSVSLWDVSTPLATLENLNTGPSAAIYADLGSGTQFSGGYSIVASNTMAAIPLDSAGIAAVNRSLGGTFAIGGSANLPVPEPAPVSLLAVALASLGAIRYRSRQAAKRSALS